MFRSGCITIIVLILLGFVFEQCWCTHISPAIAKRWAAVQKQLQPLPCCPGGYPLRTIVVTRFRVIGSGDVAGLEKDLSGIGKIAMNKSGAHRNFKVIVITDTKDSSNIGFTMHAIVHRNFQITETCQTYEYLPRTASDENI